MRQVSEEERKKMLKVLENQYKMSLESMKDTFANLKKKVDNDGRRMYTDEEIENSDSILLIKNGMEDMKAQYASMGGNPDELEKNATEKKKKMSRKPENMTIFDTVNLVNENKEEKVETKAEKKDNTQKHAIVNAFIEDRPTETYIPDESTNDNPVTSYDVIPLPSKGECYKKKTATLPIGFLTAADENIIINPNLYGQNLVIDTLLKRKILDKSIDVDDLLEGDRDAIILFLRRTGFGNEYPIKATDNKTGKEFDTVIDLSKLKYKEFNLKSDKDGLFDFMLPVSKKMVKFRFLNHRDRTTLERIEDMEETPVKKARMIKMKDELDFIAENDETIPQEKKVSLRNAIRTIENVIDSFEDFDEQLYTNRFTNELEYSIMSVDGNTDRMFIHEFVQNMPIKDSSDLRLYINKNTPGIKYELEIEKPESLGGGSMTVFPQFNQFIFLNRSK